MPKSTNRTQPNDLGAPLRQWRGARNKSQMEASLDAGGSQRHLSFIEIGRSVPSRETLIGIAEALEIPYRDRNSLLLAAGYAPMYEDAGWDEQELRSVTEALNRMLRQHEPYPAFVTDRYWNVLQTNTAAPRFFNSFVDLSSRPQPRNLLHLMFDPAGMRPFIANWEKVARTLIQRIYRESVGGVLDEKSHDLISALLAYPEAVSGCRHGRSFADWGPGRQGRDAVGMRSMTMNVDNVREHYTASKQANAVVDYKRFNRLCQVSFLRFWSGRWESNPHGRRLRVFKTGDFVRMLMPSVISV
jgi:transcriptional regulator with XRE-family HTH domain